MDKISSRLLLAVCSVMLSTSMATADTNQAGYDQPSKTGQSDQPGVFRVSPQSQITIDRHGVCRKVSNAGAEHIMVPTGQAEEWSSGQGSFLLNISQMPGISISNCGPWYEGVGAAAVLPFGGGHNSTINFTNGRQWYLQTAYGMLNPSQVGSPIIDVPASTFNTWGHQHDPNNPQNSGIPIPRATWYDKDTGECGPDNSLIGFSWPMGSIQGITGTAYIGMQLCGEGTASFPVKWDDSFDHPWPPATHGRTELREIPSFDRR